MNRHSSGVPRERADSGLTLIEVVVALFLLGIVATASLTFFVRGMQSTSHLQRSQVAVAVANQAMELSRSVPATLNGAGVPGILVGRAQADVLTSFTNNPTAGTDMNAAWDPTAATSANAVIPITTTKRVSDQDFDVTTLIGTCWRSKVASASAQSCTQTDPGSAVKIFRTVVVVTWGPVTGSCAGGVCRYSTSSLVDVTDDASWNLTAKPVAYDDAGTAVSGGTAVQFDILANDVIGALTSNPTTVLSGPSLGTATVRATGAGMGLIDYTPPANASGVTQIMYKLRDSAGRRSNDAVLEITVNPAARTDSVTVVKTTATPIDVLANDRGTGLGTVVITSAPGRGSATVDGGQILYQAPNTAGNTSLEYMVRDANGLESAPGTVTISVTNGAAAIVSDQALSLPYSDDEVTTDLDVLDLTGNPDDFTIVPGTLTPASTPAGALVLSSDQRTLEFVQPAGMPAGLYTLTFRVRNNGGDLSTDQATYDITIDLAPVTTPVAVADTVPDTPKNTWRTIDVGANDLPASADWAGAYTIKLSNKTCGFWKRDEVLLDAGKMGFRIKNGNKSCSFDYRIVSTTDNTVFSDTTTVSMWSVN